MAEAHTVRFLGHEDITLVKWKVKSGSKVNRESLLCSCQGVSSRKIYKLTSDCNGTVNKTVFNEGDIIRNGDTIALVTLCTHPTVWRNMCAECGTYLKGKETCSAYVAMEHTIPDLLISEMETCSASVAMEHTIPDLLISEMEAQVLGKEDEIRLLKSRQLVLLVDLDQTLIHTTNDNIPNNLKDVYHFQLPHGRPQDLRWYHTKFRPRTEQFLENMSKLFELHICTFGVRSYAHTIARFLDPDGKYFQQRILSRDECFHPTLKTSNLKALFPCGDSMVCIIDDRQDVWKNAPNLVHVKPYLFFDGTADINAPPEADKMLPDATTGEFGDGTIAAPKTSRRQAKIIKIRKQKAAAANGNKNQMESKIKEKHEENSEIKEENSEIKEENSKIIGENSEIKEENSEIKEENSEIKDKDLTSSTEAEVNVKSLNGGETTESTESEISSNFTTDEKSSDAGNHGDGDVTKKASSSEAEAQPSERVVEEVSEVCSMEGEDEEEEVVYIEWEDADDYLIYLEDILQRIHAAFYEMHDELKKNNKAPVPDLKKIVPYVRKKVLRGANILFSGVFPTNQVPETAYAYQLALSLGATVHLNFIPPGASGNSKNIGATTHLVAAKLGTEKVRMVSKFKDVKIVNPNWLWTCGDRWEWVDERLYPLNEETSQCFLMRESPDPNTGQRAGVTASITSADSSVECVEKDSAEVKLKADNLGMSSSTYEDMLKDFENNFTENDDDENDEEEEDNTRIDDKNECESESESVKQENKLRQKVLRKRKLDESSSESESLSGDYPKGWKNEQIQKKQKIDDSDKDDEDLEDSDKEDLGNGSSSKVEEQLSSSDDDSDSGESNPEVDNLAEFIEREYLS